MFGLTQLDSRTNHEQSIMGKQILSWISYDDRFPWSVVPLRLAMTRCSPPSSMRGFVGSIRLI